MGRKDEKEKKVSPRDLCYCIMKADMDGAELSDDQGRYSIDSVCEWICSNFIVTEKPKPKEEKPRKVEFKEGSFEQQLYSYWVRELLKMPVEKLFLPESDLRNEMECKLFDLEVSAVKVHFQTHIYSMFNVWDEVYKWLLNYREKHREQTLF